ncbi:MAG: EamA family transporter [Candidatus Absconditicoccaceae bacterium]
MNGLAQVLRKKGLVGFSFEGDIFKMIYMWFKNPYLVGGLLLYAISFIVRLWVLSKIPVSYAYPFLALSFVVVIIGGYILGEQINLIRIIGISLIVVGIVFISQS